MRIDTDHCHSNALPIRGEPRWALLIRVDVLTPLSSHTPVKEPAGKQFDRKPTLLGWQAHREPTGRNPKRYETTATPTRIIQSGTYAWVKLR